MLQKKNEVKIDINPDIFNAIYWHLLKYFSSSSIRFIWVYGGSSASKTYSVVQLLIVKMLEGEGENALVLRKYAVDIRDSIYSDFKSIITDWGLSAYFLMQQNYIYCTLTGSYIRFRGLDDSEKIKGISNFKRVVLEEISQFEEADLKQIRKRLRGRENQQIIGIFNPVSEESWIKTNVFDLEVLHQQETKDMAGLWINDKGNLVIMKTNYLYNKYIVGPNFIDQHTIDDFEKDKVVDYEYYRIYGLGDWGKIRTGGEFWKKFVTSKHINNVGWQKEYPISLSLDENINPYLTCLVWQIIGKKAQQIDEICLSDPLNRVKDVCKEFTKRYPVGEVSGLFIYGDRTSVKEDTKMEKGENFFTEVMKYLKDYRPTLRLQSRNPSVALSGKFINEIYEGESVSGITIFINEKCKKSIFDYQYALEDSDGTIKKTRRTHPVTKVSYEEFGHASDSKRYLITKAFENEYTAFLSGKKNNLKILSSFR